MQPTSHSCTEVNTTEFFPVSLVQEIKYLLERKTDFRKCLDERKRQNESERIRKFVISKNLLCKTTNDFFSIQSKELLEIIT